MSEEELAVILWDAANSVPEPLDMEDKYRVIARTAIATLRARPNEGTFAEEARMLHTAAWKALIHLGTTNDRLIIIDHYNDYVTPDEAATALRDALIMYRNACARSLTVSEKKGNGE